jgi:hypothetical protein
MTGEPTSEIQGYGGRQSLLASEAAAPEAPELTHTFVHWALLLSLGCALLLALTSTRAGAASAKTSAAKISARLTAPEFVASQVGSIKLVYKVPASSKSFSYRLSIKRSSRWLPMRKVTKKGSFKGRMRMPVGKLFVGHKIKVGNYLVDLSCAGAHTLLRFRISPFYGRLTKKSFTISQARSIKLIYGFSKPSKTFTYRLIKKTGSKWQVLRSVKRTKKARRLYFVGGKTASLKSIFAKKAFKLGKYRLKISSAYSTRQLNFAIVKSAKPATGVGGSGSGSGSGNGSAGDADFTISGGVSGLEPGMTAPVKLTLTNPHSAKIYVTRLTISMSADSTPSGCSRDSNFTISQSNASSADPITVPAKGKVTLTSAPRAPQITFLNLSTNQDACKNASFALTFSGIAHT